LTSGRLDDLARGLGDAWARAVTVAAPTTVEPSLTTLDAYAIQDLMIQGRIGAGRKIAGWKLGLTSSDPPQTPIVGTLLDDMVVGSGAELSLATMVEPMVEAECVVQIGETVDGPVTIEELLAGPHLLGPGIEVIDYRTVDSTGSIDWIADNSTVAYAVVGDLTPVSKVDAAAMEVTLSTGDTTLATGLGAKVMGNPLAAVVWLSGHLAERGRSLEKGEVVLTGSLTGHHLVDGPDSEYRADFGDLGQVSVRFVA
jgi:2-keto-4-pentenoate hydratase